MGQDFVAETCGNREAEFGGDLSIQISTFVYA
jgi:hypothetical protein